MRLTQYPDVEHISQTRTVELRPEGWGDDAPPITLTVRSLPPDYGEKTEELLPSPTPPRLGPEMVNGRVVRDEDNRPLIKYDEHNPEYRKELRETNQLQSVKMILDGLMPGQIEFETPGSPEEDARAFYRGIRDEMTAFGFGLGDHLRLVEEIARVSNIDERDLEGATAGFFEKESSPSSSSNTKSVSDSD